MNHSIFKPKKLREHVADFKKILEEFMFRLFNDGTCTFKQFHSYRYNNKSAWSKTKCGGQVAIAL